MQWRSLTDEALSDAREPKLRLVTTTVRPRRCQVPASADSLHGDHI